MADAPLLLLPPWVLVLLCIIACQCLGLSQTRVTQQAIPTWYAQLKKPTLTPPNTLFPVVWTMLYTLMGVTLALLILTVQTASATHPALALLARLALASFVIQAVCNGIWSWLFFGQHRLGWALYDIIMLWFGIAATIVFAWPVNPLAAQLMIPYLLWTSYAVWLNWSLWKLNRDEVDTKN